MKRIKVTGYIEISDEEYDPGPKGPLTQSAFESYMDDLAFLDDVEFEEVPR